MRPSMRSSAPLTIAAEYVEKISRGDIPPAIVDSYNGDFNAIKDNLNILIDSMNEITRTAKEIAGGNLMVKRERAVRPGRADEIADGDGGKGHQCGERGEERSRQCRCGKPAAELQPRNRCPRAPRSRRHRPKKSHHPWKRWSRISSRMRTTRSRRRRSPSRRPRTPRKGAKP